MTPTGLSVRSVSKRFASHQAVADVSLELADGESLALLGPSGCGKTTLLRLIAGLEVPDEGEIWVGNRQVSAARRSMVPPHARAIGFVFQDLALWPHLTVRQHIDFVLAAGRVAREQRTARAAQALALVRVDGLSNRYPHELSGGEQQRVALARALVAQPGMLLLDEPLSSIDPELRSTLRLELAGMLRQLRVTTICVTHDREDAVRLANRIVEMRGGRIVGGRSIAEGKDVS